MSCCSELKSFNWIVWSEKCYTSAIFQEQKQNKNLRKVRCLHCWSTDSWKSVWEEPWSRAACHLADCHFDRWYKNQAGRKLGLWVLLGGMLSRIQQLINILPHLPICLQWPFPEEVCHVLCTWSKVSCCFKSIKLIPLALRENNRCL